MKKILSLLKHACFGIAVFALNANAQNNEQKINDLISKMKLEEKVNMLHASSSFTSGGVPRLGIPELVMSDGPHSVRVEHGRDWDTSNDTVNDAGTYLPTGVALGATWNPELGYRFGSVLGSEANARGKDVILGPGINIIRTPLNGRNFEYLSEDPYLISKMVVGYIKGVQDQGISACVKHYIANNQEVNRDFIDVHMSERALREIYLPGFKAAVQEGGTNTLMGAYNKFRGQWASHNYYLLNTILKREWNFQGVVISDWNATHNTMEALYSGLDIEMGTEFGLKPFKGYGTFFMADTVVSLVRQGKVKESVIDDKVRRILRVMFKTGMMDKSRKPGQFATKEHQNTALEIAREAIVLLKNEQNILPLNENKIKTVLVIGVNAFRPNAFGGGSSQAKATYEITPLEGIKKYLGDKVKVVYQPGYLITKDAKADPALIKAAVAAAKKADAVIYVGGWVHGYNEYKQWSENAYDAESVDKPDMNLPFGQDQVIEAVLEAKPNTVMLLMGGGPVDMTRWITRAKAIIQGWYPGMEGGTAIAEIIFGKTNPSGKLPMSFPKKLQDSAPHKLDNYEIKNLIQHYTEDIYVGYRYFDTYKIAPQFAFGHGLSYTSFEYKDLKINKNSDKRASVSLSVKNTGTRTGGEVVQLYVKQQNPKIERPEKELKSFMKVFLKPGETAQVSFDLDENAFQYFDQNQNKWVMDKDKFVIMVGSSSSDLRLKANLDL